jgi:hypothetical protein
LKPGATTALLGRKKVTASPENAEKYPFTRNRANSGGRKSTGLRATYLKMDSPKS